MFTHWLWAAAVLQGGAFFPFSHMLRESVVAYFLQEPDETQTQEEQEA